MTINLADLGVIIQAADAKAESFYSPWTDDSKVPAVPPPQPAECYSAIFPIAYNSTLSGPSVLNLADADASLQAAILLSCTNRYSTALTSFNAKYKAGATPSLTCPDGRQVKNVFVGVDPALATCLSCGGSMSDKNTCVYPPPQPTNSNSATTMLLVGGGVAVGLYLLFK